jgi:DNA-binding NarL/FixJ family response regulator
MSLDPTSMPSDPRVEQTGEDEGGEPATAAHRRLRVVLVDDSALFRSGLASLLEAAGVEVVAELGDARALASVIRRWHPDVVVLDVRMPPTHTDEGIKVALDIREGNPRVGVLVLSTYAEGVWAARLLAEDTTGLGYLLKDRVQDVDSLVEALQRVAEGGTAVDPEVVSRLLHLNAGRRSLSELSSREMDVLALMAEGLSNIGIARRLALSPRTVEAHVAALFTKLPLAEAARSHNRRVLAVLSYLRTEG